MGKKIDMSPQAVSARLQEASDLRDVCIALAGPRLKWDWRKLPPGAELVVRETYPEYRVKSRE